MKTPQDLYALVAGRLEHPTIKHFYKEFERLGISHQYITFLEYLPENLQKVMLHIFKTHVTKEKALITYALTLHITKNPHKATLLGFVVDLLWLMSLVYDDIEDSDESRSGLPTTWKLYGESTCKEFLQASLKYLLNIMATEISTDAMRLCGELTNLGITSIQQHKNMGLMSTQEQILANYKERSAFHDRFAVTIAYWMAGKSPEDTVLEALIALNLAGQILNDVKDFQGKEWYGRKSFTDIKSGLITYPIRILYQKASPEDKEILEQLFGKDAEATDSVIPRMVAQYNLEASIVDDVIQYYKLFYQTFEKLLGDAPEFQYFKLWYEYKIAQVQKIA